MEEFDKIVLQTFLQEQGKLFPEPVASTEEEAESFLLDCLAVVCDDIQDVREYLDEMGMDVTGLTDEELEEAEEVFVIPDGRYLVVEG